MLEYLELSRLTSFEQLEDRRLLSITYDLSNALQAYNTGVGAVGNAATASAVVDQVLGTGTLPVANQTLDQGLGIAGDFLKPFQTTLNQNASDWSTIASQLQAAGFTIHVAFTGTPDANNDLLEVNWTQTLTPSDPIQIVGKTGFSYLDGGGGLYGGISGTGSVTLSLTFGVDVNPANQSLKFFIAPGNAVQASLSGSTAANGLSGTIAIGDLSTVNVTSTASINFTGTLALNTTASESDGKLRASDLTSNLSQVVTGGVNGSANLNAAFSAQLFGLPNVNWTGTLSDAVTNNALQSPMVNLQEPSASSLLGSLGSSLFSLGGGIPILGPLSNTINRPLPLIGKSIGQLTGLDNHLPSRPSLPSGFSDLNGSYPLAGGTLTVNVTPTTIDDFLRGQQVSLVSWQASADVTLANDNLTIPIFSLGVPDIASLDIDATFGIHASLHYDIGFGLDGHGFYALAGTPSDPALGLSFGVTAGLQGQVEVFGIPLAQAGGDLGFSITPYVTLTAAPAFVDPATDPSKVYFNDLALFGKDPATDLLDDVSSGIAGDFTGDVYAKINLLLFSIGFNWGISIPVFNYERSPTWPSPTGSGPGVTAWPNVTQNGGVLTFNGTAADDNVTLTPGSNGSLTVAWAGQGSETFNNVTSFVFNGGSGNDTLTAASGLDIPVRADGGSGNDDFNLGNNAANNTLIAGTGQNTLVGGSGADLLIGGAGDDTIIAGSGPATIFGGSGNASVTLGSGKDSFYGGAGNYNIQGGSGTYTIDGGSGSDVINAGAGLNDIIYGGSAGGNHITGSSAGYTTIYGGGPGDNLVGLGGHDTIYGSAGPSAGGVTNNIIIGGPLGGNLIFGGGSGDFLAGGGGNNTLYAGTGNETLAGGDGLDLVVNPSGNGLIDSSGDAKSSGSSLLIAGPGSDTMFGDSTGHNTLQGGPGSDTLYAGSGGDALIAGPGSDALYGSVGNDTFQLPFTPPGQTQPNDTLVGGGGSDTLYVKAESGTGTAGLNVTSDAIIDATITSVTVSNGSPIAADLPANGSGLVIQIGTEQMLVTKVLGNTLTVQRGYNDTTAAPHGNNALVLLPDTAPALPAPSDYELYLNQGSTADSYAATLSTLRFATTTAGSTTVTGIDSTTGLAVGEPVTGPGIAAGTTIASIASTTSITLSTPATLSQGDLPLTFGTVGTLSFTLPGDIANIQLEGGPGNNLLQVDPSVTRDVTLYGGPGNNVLMAGSGNDALIAGPGTAVLYGGTGQDTFYAGDLPSQDVVPSAGTDPALTVSNNTNNPVDGNDTVIAGPGNDELFAGSGNDLLIGGSVARIVDPVTGTPGVALLQAGQYQLVEGAGRDLLVGGTGNDVLIAGPGGPGSILEGGTGNNTLIAQNYGINTFSGGKGAGHTLILGGNLENTEISNSTADGGNTLVGGLGIDNITAGAGNDVLYASYNAAAWSQGEAAAAAAGVHVVPPQFFQGDANSQQLQTLLEEEQAGTLPANQRVVLGSLFLDELDTLQNEEDNLTAQVKNYLSLLNQSSDVNPALSALLNAVDQQDQLVLIELSTLIGDIQNFIGGSPFQPDLLTGGSGNDTFYGNVDGATQMVGGSGENVFYNDNPSDTIQGGSGGDNTLVLQGDGSMTLTQDPTNVNAVDFSVNGGQPLVVGDTGNVSNIQMLEILTGSGNDTVTVNLTTLPPGSPAPGLSGLDVISGSGNDTVDASMFSGNETLAGGSGNDVIKIGSTIGTASELIGTSTTELDLVDTTNQPVTVSKNLPTSSGIPTLEIGATPIPLGQYSTFGKLIVVGGSGSDSFSTDGSIPNVLLEGGSGSNVFSVSGGTATLIGGNAANNSFTVTGPGKYDIIGGTPTAVAAAPATSSVVAAIASGISQSSSTLPQVGFDDLVHVATVGTRAIFATTHLGGGTLVEIYDASTNAWSYYTTSQNFYTVATATVGAKALFAGGVSYVGAQVSNAVYIYDANTNTWSTAALSQARANISVATVGTMAIFAGGSGATGASNAVDIYDASTNTWSSHTLSQGRYNMAVATVGTKAIFAGGDTGEGVGANGRWQVFYSSAVDIYDATTNTWSTASLSQARGDGILVATVGTKAVFAGGEIWLSSQDTSGSSNAVDIYDATSKTWSTHALSQTGSYGSVTTVGTVALFKANGSVNASNVVDVYNAFTNTWSTASLSVARVSIAVATVGTKAIFAGGYGATGASNAVDIYDASTNTWSTAALSQARSSISVAAVGTRVIFAGGYDAATADGYSDAVDIYDASTSTWSTAALSQSRAYIGTASVGTEAVFAGGFNSNRFTGAVDIFTFPPMAAVNTPSTSSNGTATISYTLTGEPSNADSIQVQYSVNGGPWYVATAGTGGDGTTNLTASQAGAAHTFIWNTAHDLGNTNNPSVRVRITPMDTIGTGVTVASAPFAVNNSGIVNALTIDFTNDSSDDIVTLTQSGQTVSFNGSLAGASQNLLGTATNLTSLAVNGGTGKNRIDASGVQVPATLNGGAGSGADTLIGGSGSNTLYYSGVGSTYDGGSGTNNVLDYPANAGDAIAYGGGELLVNDQSKSIGSMTNIENFFASAMLNNGTQFLVPVNDVPLTNVAITGVIATAASPAVTLAGSFNDPYPNATAGTDAATINWGDGTSSTETITGSGGNFTVSASHIYANNGSWTIVLTVIDPAGSAASVGYSFTGGLTLDASGNLNAYSSASAFTQVATGVASYAIRNPDGRVFVLDAAGALSSISSTGTGTQFPGTYQSIALGPDGGLYALQASGNLGKVAVNSANIELVNNGVQAIVADTTGDLYKLYTTGALSVMPAGSTTWTSLLTNVKSVTPSGNGVNVLTKAGVDWQYVGTTATLIAGPHLSLTIPGTAAAQSVSAKLSVLDVNNNPVLGYTGTVTFSDSDGAAVAADDGPPPPHTFSAADNGAFSFPVAFLTSGSQTLTAVSNDGLTASASVTVSAGAATQFSVDPPPVPVGTPIPITAAAWASDVVTITTPPIAGGFSVGDTLTISGMTPTGYNGTITVASALSDSQFTYLLTTDPGTATGFGSVTPQATITVTAYDAYGNVASGYTGAVTLMSVDSSAASPMTSAANQGVAQFTETFNQPGGQKLIATGGSLAGNGAIVVTPAPYDLSQSSVSVSPEGVAAGGQVVVSLTARDALGNAETSGSLKVTFSLGTGSVGGGSFTTTTDNHDGTYTAIFTAGPYAGLDNITATIGGVAVTSSPASLVVTPAITSANTATFIVGTDGSFTLTQKGTAAPVFSESGKLPNGVTFDSSTGTISGRPAAGSGGVYNLVLGAATASGPAGTQNFTLVVDQPPTITSANSTAFTAYTSGTFTVTTAAGTYPSPTFSETGTLPPGVTLSPSGVLSGIPAAGSDGDWSIVIDASNGVSPDNAQPFTLVIDQAPAITSAAGTTFAVGAAGTFNVTTSGFPTPTFNITGTLPTGVTLTDNKGGTATLTTTAATPAGVYPFTIDAANGVSPDATQSFTLTVTQATPIITWANPADITYGTALGAAQLDATATLSGNTVPGTFRYTLTDGTTSAIGVVLHAGQNQVLNVTFTPTDSTDYATETRQVEINVDPAPLTIAAGDKSKVYGAALPALTASYTGFVNGDSAASLTTPPSLSTTATAGSHVSGSPYTITATGASDSDYTISYVAGKLTVTPAALTITADDKSKVYGAALPTLTASYSGFVNGDSATSLTTAPSLSTTATASSHVSASPYAITASGAADTDYAISYVSGSLTVTPATLTVTANDASRTYGTANPTFTDIVTGFANGDDDSVLSGAASLTTTATTNSPVGSYPITAAQGTLSAADYVFAFQNGALTVTVNAQGSFGLVEDIYVIGIGTVSVSAANGVLANDTGPGLLTVTTGTVTGAEGGTFVFNADGSFTYTPAASFPGFDYAKYTAQDSVGDQATATVNVLSQTGGVVWKFYESVLHRDPDYPGLQYWINDFSNGGKTGDIAVGFFESTELLNQIIGGYYQQYLGRGADSGGLNYWEGVWHQTGGPEGIKAGFASSPEFNALANREYGSYASPWLEALYHRILNRAPDPNGLSYWEQQLASGTSQYQIALDFFNSQEAFDNDVTGWFSEYLDRAPTPAEQAYYAGQMEHGATDRDIEQEITNLSEYGANPPASPPGAGVRLPDYLPQTTANNQTAIAATDAVFARIGGE